MKCGQIFKPENNPLCPNYEEFKRKKALKKEFQAKDLVVESAEAGEIAALERAMDASCSLVEITRNPPDPEQLEALNRVLGLRGPQKDSRRLRFKKS